jgi:hypothetical protein
VEPDAHDLLVEVFEPVGAVQFGAALSGEGHLGEGVLLTVVHPRGELGPTAAQLVGEVAPSLVRGVGAGFLEDLADRSGNHGVVALRGVYQGVAHPMHARAIEKLLSPQPQRFVSGAARCLGKKGHPWSWPECASTGLARNE